MSSVRLGDTVTMQAGDVVLDTAQAQTSVSGIVAIAPEPDGDVMTVQMSPTRTTLVDIDPQTRINGKLPSVTSRLSIMDADQVRVVGILDKTLDEMTQAWTIDRVNVPAAPSSRIAAPA
jgi:hypothetical protein